MGKEVNGMRLSNRELQQRKNCQLYIYILESLGKDIPEYIEECALYDETYDYNALVDCVPDLAKLVQSFDEGTFERIVHNKESEDAQKLAQWWEMYKMYIPIDDFSKK